MFNVGDRVIVIEYPIEKVVTLLGTVIETSYDEDDPFTEVRLDVAPELSRPWDTDYLFYDGEIEVI